MWIEERNLKPCRNMAENFLAFWLRFIYPNLSAIEEGVFDVEEIKRDYSHYPIQNILFEDPKGKLELIGIYSTVIHLMREGEFEKLEKFLGEL